MTDRRVALVSGANRGIGLEVARQLAELGFVVEAGSRSVAAGQEAVSGMGDVRVVQLDVSDPDSIESAIATIADREGRMDVLVNNAAIHYDASARASTPDFATIREALETNLFGAWQLTTVALPLLRRSDAARIVNVSSGAGALSDMGGGLPAYKISKVSLNALTRMLAAELATDRILVNAVCPGGVATDMGGGGGRPVADGAAGIVWAATLPDAGPTGGFFRDGRPIDW